MLHFQSEKALLATDQHCLSQNSVAVMLCYPPVLPLSVNKVFIGGLSSKKAAGVREPCLPLDGAWENLCKGSCKGPCERTVPGM